MRLATALLTLTFTACNTTPVSQNPSQAASPSAAPASVGQKPSTDSPLEFLLTSAANDFRDHRPPVVARFRNVRFGHFTNPEGRKQYLLCGEFLPEQQAKAEWSPFVTIKTSGYEQWIGVQAASYCQPSKVVFDNNEDLSSSLQSRLDSPR